MDKYEYQKMPMGLCYSPEFFQEKMGKQFHRLDYLLI